MISVIIPSLNSPLIADVTQAVLDQAVGEHDLEVIVVGRDDQGCVPTTPRVRFLDTQVPVGPARARNLGVQQAHGSIICFLDADCVATAEWLPTLLAAHHAGHLVIGGGVALVIHSYWSLCDDLLVFNNVLSWTAAGPRHVLPSLNMCFDRSVLIQCGGFDEQFFPAGEDTDLSYRVQRLGYELHCEPRAAVQHCHARRGFTDVARHLHTFGAAQAQLQATHPDQLVARRGRQFAAQFPQLVCVAAPVLAAKDVVVAFAKGAIPMRYWFALPGLILAKAAWYVGLGRAWHKRKQQWAAAL